MTAASNKRALAEAMRRGLKLGIEHAEIRWSSPSKAFGGREFSRPQIDWERAEAEVEKAIHEARWDAQPVCSVCNDTHRVERSNGRYDDDARRLVLCTHCPTPCPECASSGGVGAYCAQTPCACACHVKGAP